MFKETQAMGDRLSAPERSLEGGHGGEMLDNTMGRRNRLQALVATVMAGALSLSPRPLNASGQAETTSSVQKSHDAPNALAEASAAPIYASETRHYNPETYVAPPSSQNVNDHCDIPQGKEGAGFKGQMIDGVLQPGHNFKYRAYARTHGGNMYLCFDFPAENGHPKGHWVAKLLGPEKIWSTGTKEITSRNLNNCPDVNPCV